MNDKISSKTTYFILNPNFNQDLRNELLGKLYIILDITENNKMFTLKELDMNEKKQQDIIDLEVKDFASLHLLGILISPSALLVPVNIKRYFLCKRFRFAPSFRDTNTAFGSISPRSNWTYFKHRNRDWKRKYLSLIKAIFKDMGINIKTQVLLDKSISKSETQYIVDIY